MLLQKENVMKLKWQKAKPNSPGFYVCDDGFGLPYTVEVRKVGRGMRVLPLLCNNSDVGTSGPMRSASGPMRSIPENVTWMGPLPDVA